MTRRPATAEDMTIGATVYKGNGKVAYRVAGIFPEVYGSHTGYNVVKTTSKVKQGRYCEPLRVFTVEV